MWGLPAPPCLLSRTRNPPLLFTAPNIFCQVNKYLGCLPSFFALTFEQHVLCSPPVTGSVPGLQCQILSPPTAAVAVVVVVVVVAAVGDQGHSSCGLVPDGAGGGGQTPAAVLA